MKFIDGIKQLQGSPSIIPDTHRFDFPEFLVEMGYKVGAEIGVHKGEYTERFCKVGLSMYAVDPWMAFWGQGRTQAKQDVQDGYYQEAYDRLSVYDNCAFIRKTSMDAISDFKDNSLDFVYIDANHDFVNFIQDIHYWYKKVKVGGIISGHDYAYYSYSKFNHVKRALIAYARCYRMIPVFAVMYDSNGLKRDHYRSWFYVK